MPGVRVVLVEASAGGVVGGSLTATIDLLRSIDRDRVVPTLVRFAPSPLTDALPGVRTHVLTDVPSRRTPSHRVRAVRGMERLAASVTVTLPRARALARIFEAEQPDVILACNGVHPNVDAVAAAAWCRVPVVCHHRSYRRVGWEERLASRTLHTVSGVTDEVVEYYRDRGVRAQRYVTIHDAIDTEALRPGGGEAVRRELGIPPEAPVVGLVGNVQEWKGHDLVVDAIARSRSEVPGLVCLLVGGVHATGRRYADALRRRLSDPDLGRAVRWLGARSDVPACMHAMDIVLHASVRPEPFGRVVLEAMAVGRPVVAPREGGPTVTVVDGETGLLVRPRDARALADAMIGLLRDPVRRRAMGEAGRVRVEERFDVTAQARAMEGVLTTAAATGGR